MAVPVFDEHSVQMSRSKEKQRYCLDPFFRRGLFDGLNGRMDKVPRAYTHYHTLMKRSGCVSESV